MLSYNAKRKRGIHKIALLIGLLTANTLCACTNAKQVLGVNHYNTPLRFPQENKDLLAEKETAAKLEEGSGHFARLLQNGTITLEQVLKEIGKQKDSIERTKELLAIIKIVHPNLARLVANRTITLEQALKEIQKGSMQKTSWTAKRTLKWIAGTTIALSIAACGIASIYYCYYYTPTDQFSYLKTPEDHLQYIKSITTINEAKNYLANIDVEDRQVRSNKTIKCLMLECPKITRTLHDLARRTNNAILENIINNDNGQYVMTRELHDINHTTVGKVVYHPSKLLTIVDDEDPYGKYFDNLPDPIDDNCNGAWKRCK